MYQAQIWMLSIDTVEIFAGLKLLFKHLLDYLLVHVDVLLED